MRISQNTKVRAAKAAELYQQHGNLSRVARETGIHRSTLDRWRAEGLLDLDTAGEEPEELSLDDMVSKALRVIDRALEGEKITPFQIRAAIEVIKGSNALRAQAKVEKAQQSLAELIASESESD